MITFSTLYLILLTTITLLAKPIVQNIPDNEIDPQSYSRVYKSLGREDSAKILSLSVSSATNNDEFVSGIKNFQQTINPAMTGVSVESTKQQMLRPRCGVKDHSRISRQRRMTKNYLNSGLWNKTLRTYRVGSFASYNQISRPRQESILDDAFYEWSKHAPLTFEKVCQTCPSDIVIEFIDDDLDNHFDNDQKAAFGADDLAHAMYPWSSYPAFIHFNKKINFTDR